LKGKIVLSCDMGQAGVLTLSEDEERLAQSFSRKIFDIVGRATCEAANPQSPWLVLPLADTKPSSTLFLRHAELRLILTQFAEADGRRRHGQIASPNAGICRSSGRRYAGSRSRSRGDVVHYLQRRHLHHHQLR